MKYTILVLSIVQALFILTYSQDFPPLSKYAIGLRYNRYGRSEFDYQDPIRNCGKRKRTVEINRKCFRQCQTDADCRGSKRKCLCDGECGLSCVRITTVCQKIGEFSNGFVNYFPDNFFGAQLAYECNPGYILVGDKIRICEGDGWWSGTSPTCVKETFCNPPIKISNAIANIQSTNTSKFKTDTEVEYQCDIGYTMNSDKEMSKIICLDNGKWSDVKFKCTRIDCGKPDEIENGVLKGVDFYYSSVIEYKCYTGYRIRSGDHLRECGLDAKWSGRKPLCEPVDCGEPPYTKNAIPNYNITRYGNKVKYTCTNSRYYIEGNDEITCQSNGRWSEPYPTCLEKQCRLDSKEYTQKIYNLFTSSLSIPSTDNFTYSTETSVKFICEPGYVLTESYNEVICLYNEGKVNWNLLPPKCRKENFCSFLTPPENGIITSNKKQSPQGYHVNSTVEFKCSLGFVLKGTTSLNCKETVRRVNDDFVYEAEWDGVNESSCESVVIAKNDPCKMEESENIQFLNESLAEFIQSGDSIMYNCKTNRDHKFMAKCVNGSFIMEQNCSEIESKASCLAPPKLLNGYNKYSSTQHGSKVWYQCLNGYELSKGSSELKCVNGEWIGSIPICTKINCAFPGHLDNGKIYYIGTLAEYAYHPYMNTLGQNKQIRYECDKDYKLVGPNGSTCINGNWKPSIKLVKCVQDEHVSVFNVNETLRSDLDENIISIGLKNERKIKSLFNAQNDGLNRRKSKKNLKLRRLSHKKQKSLNGTNERTKVRRKIKKVELSSNLI